MSINTVASLLLFDIFSLFVLTLSKREGFENLLLHFNKRQSDLFYRSAKFLVCVTHINALMLNSFNGREK